LHGIIAEKNFKIDTCFVIAREKLLISSDKHWRKRKFTQ